MSVFLDEGAAVTAFLNLLGQWTQPEIEEQLRHRVEFSKRAIGKLLQVRFSVAEWRHVFDAKASWLSQAFDRLQQRNENLWEAIKKKADEEADEQTQNLAKSDADSKGLLSHQNDASQ